jgi:hypothetical protein
VRILFEHKECLPVRKYGGTERIIFWLMKELVQMGHCVTLIGHPKSKVEELGIKLIPKDPSLLDWRKFVPKETELIHLFYTPPFPLPWPNLVTIQGNGGPSEEFQKNTVFISKKHAEIHGSLQFFTMDWIYLSTLM